MTSTGAATIRLAQELVALDQGHRIDTVANYADKFDLGRGTIQAAMKYLEDEGAIHLEPRGHLGTFATFLDYRRLWVQAGGKPVTGVMPLPYSKRYEGFATGLYCVFGSAAISFNMAYVRGSSSRLSALRQGKYDFAVTSRLAAERGGTDLEIVLDFGKGSYVSGHHILFAPGGDREVRAKMRVGLDESSVDHSVLTMAECAGKAVQYEKLPYSQIIKSLLAGKIDAAVWNVDEVLDRGYQIPHCPLTSEEARELDQSDTVAVIVIRDGDAPSRNLLRSVIDAGKVLKIQQLVLEDKLLPSY